METRTLLNFNALGTGNTFQFRIETRGRDLWFCTEFPDEEVWVGRTKQTPAGGYIYAPSPYFCADLGRAFHIPRTGTLSYEIYQELCELDEYSKLVDLQKAVVDVVGDFAYRFVKDFRK